MFSSSELCHLLTKPLVIAILFFVMKKTPKFTKTQTDETDRVAKLITLHCARNTFIEDLHAGIFPDSKIGDYSDVKVVTPFGEIPWNQLSRINNDEMKILNKEIVNKVFTFLLHLQTDTLPSSHDGLYFPAEWDVAEIDEKIKRFWDQAQKRKEEK